MIDIVEHYLDRSSKVHPHSNYSLATQFKSAMHVVSDRYDTD